MDYQLVIEKFYETVIHKYIGFKKKQDAKDHQTIKSFDNLYRKCLQDSLIDKNEYDSLCNFSNEDVDEKK